jgi:chemotaxis family two-component system response regulator PixG
MFIAPPPMPQEESGITRFRQIAATIYQKQATGRIIMTGDRWRWKLYFHRGRLIWAHHKVHRVRRWLRAVLHDCPTIQCSATLDDQAEIAAQPFWEIRLLHQAAIDNQSISIRQGRKALRAMALEVLFVATYEPVEYEWQVGKIPYASPDLALPAGAIVSAIREVVELQERWRTLGVDVDFINSALMLRTDSSDDLSDAERGRATGSSTLLSLQSLLNGQRTFWDVMQRMERSSSVWVRILNHFIQQDVIEFVPLPDLPTPLNAIKTIAPRANVVCIEPDPTTCQRLTAPLTQAGYACTHIHDSLRAVPALLELRPDVVLVATAMPIVTGYEVCAQLRRVDLLKAVPVILLGDRPTPIERMHGKIVGATDFLTTPCDPKKLLETVSRYLDKESDPAKSSGSTLSP